MDCHYMVGWIQHRLTLSLGNVRGYIGQNGWLSKIMLDRIIN